MVEEVHDEVDRRLRGEIKCQMTKFEEMIKRLVDAQVKMT